MTPTPPKLNDLRAGTRLVAGLGHSTILPDMDFETYSPAGYVWDSASQKFVSPRGSNAKGLPVVGVAVYTEHPDAEVLSLAYNLKDGKGAKLWTPNAKGLPDDLLSHIKAGKIIEAWNVSFEHWVWNNICVRKYGFPPLAIEQLRCAAAKARAYALPGSLTKAGEVLQITNQKDKDGARLITKFCIPKNPTRTNKHVRNLPLAHDPDTDKLYNYNLRDIEAESEISSLVPDLPDDELEFWLCDRAINYRGVQVDITTVTAAIRVIEEAYTQHTKRLQEITNHKVNSINEIKKLTEWMNSYGVFTPSLCEKNVIELLSTNLPEDVKQVLEIRQLIGSAAVKKLYALLHQTTKQGRVHDLFIYHSARTGRAAGTGPQPQNFPNSGPHVAHCTNEPCRKYYSKQLQFCPWCGCDNSFAQVEEWNANAAEDAITTISTGDLACVEYHWGNAIEVVSGCLRGMFISAAGKDLICSDYSAIEAVVLAALAGEEWRLEVFRTHGKIYEMSASKITGVPFEELINHHQQTGQHHPLRKKVGKVAELASGYQGWIGAWKQFGADEFFNEEEIKQAVLAWRNASPQIVKMWSHLEQAAIQAVNNPGEEFHYQGIKYIMRGRTLYCQLPSNRHITYHNAQLEPSDRRPGALSLTYETWNTNPLKGAIGWQRVNTYGGKLTENVVQAVARDILAHAIMNLEACGYPVVLHIHDEVVCEVPENYGSIEEFEGIMSTLPQWASDWPIKANGGWRGKRYRK